MMRWLRWLWYYDARVADPWWNGFARGIVRGNMIALPPWLVIMAGHWLLGWHL
jgi:hypothetical protein